MGKTYYDILIQIRKELPPKFKCFYVRGHQDSKVNQELGLEDNLIILLDMRAKRAQMIPPSLQEQTPDFSVMLNNEKITGSIVKEIGRVLSQDHLQQVYKKKWQNKYQNIMWEPFFNAIK
jgi:hypothetical protein